MAKGNISGIEAEETAPVGQISKCSCNSLNRDRELNTAGPSAGSGNRGHPRCASERDDDKQPNSEKDGEGRYESEGAPGVGSSRAGSGSAIAPGVSRPGR